MKGATPFAWLPPSHCGFVLKTPSPRPTARSGLTRSAGGACLPGDVTPRSGGGPLIPGVGAHVQPVGLGEGALHAGEAVSLTQVIGVPGDNWGTAAAATAGAPSGSGASNS